MRRRFAQNLLFALAANALVKPAYILLIDRTVQVRAGSEAYGRYAALLSLATIFGVVLDFGLAQYTTRRLSASPEAMGAEIGPLLRARLLLCGVYAVVVAGAAALLGFRGENLALLGGILGVQALAQTLLFLRACVASLQRFKTDSVLSILDRALLIGVMGSLLISVSAAGGFWVEWFVGAQAFCYAVAAGLAAWVLWRKSGAQLSAPGNFSQVWKVVRGSLPYATLIFFMAVYTRVDMLLLERIISPEEAGRYAAAYRLLDVGNMVGLTVAGILLPLFGRMLSERTPTGPVVRTSVNFLLPLSVAVSAVALFNGGEIMQAFYPAASLPGSDSFFRNGFLLSALMAAFPALCLTAVYSTLLTATGALREMGRMALVGALVNVVMNILFTTRFGAEAAGITATFTQWGMALAFTFAVTRRAGLAYDGAWIGRHILLAIGVLGAAFGASVMGIDWRIAAMLVLALAGGLVFVFRLVSVAEVRRIFQR